jgi:diketogulonate reductase-like aldo/keto reductase
MVLSWLPVYTTLSEPTLEDFAQDTDKTKAEVFIYWVRLCAIIGKVDARLY